MLQVLQRMIRAYYKHAHTFHDTLVTHFYGLHCVTAPHSRNKAPDAATIRAMRDICSGWGYLKFLDHYPVSKLVGCIEVVDCLRHEELASWRSVPKGVNVWNKQRKLAARPWIFLYII